MLHRNTLWHTQIYRFTHHTEALCKNTATLCRTKPDYLGQLIVTPDMVAKKIKAMKDNKSPGVDGIPPKLLMEI